MDISELIDGLIQVCVDDVSSGGTSKLLPICAQYGVTLTPEFSELFPDEYKHFTEYTEGDVTPGFSVEFEPDLITQDPYAVPGPLLMRTYAVFIRPVWRDPPELEKKLTETPRRLRRFLRAVTAAMADLFDPAVLPTNGGWTLPSGNVVLDPRIMTVDTESDIESRHAALQSTELVFVCFTYD